MITVVIKKIIIGVKPSTAKIHIYIKTNNFFK